MKKRIITFITAFCFIMSTLCVFAFAKEEKSEKKEVFFFSHADDAVKEYLLSKTEVLDSLANYLREDKGAVGDISFGMPISVRNIPMYPEIDMFYIPVFNNSKCIAVINLGIDPLGENGGYCMSMSIGFAEVFNNLLNGTYYFEYDSDDMVTYLIGENTKIIVEADRCISEYNNISGNENIIEMEQDEKTSKLFDDVVYSSSGNKFLNRSEVT